MSKFTSAWLALALAASMSAEAQTGKYPTALVGLFAWPVAWVAAARIAF